MLVLPKQAVFSDETAAELFGLPLPPGPHLMHVSVPAHVSQVRRRGMVGHVRELTDGEITEIGGLPVSTAARTYLDLAARLPRGMVLALGDALLHRRLVSMDELAAITDAHKGYRGVVRAREMLELLDPKSESPRESMLRLLLLDAGLPRPEANVNIYDSHGAFVARVDLLFRRHRVIVEYDGDQHRTDRAQYARDVYRTTQLATLGYTVLRFTAADLRLRPAWVVTTVRDALRSCS
jgi:hypothetical protein